MQKNKTKQMDANAAKRVAKAALAGNLLTVLLMAGAAVLIWKGVLPESVMQELTLGTAMLGAALSGAMSAGKGRGAAMGFAGGLAWLAVVTVAALYREQLDCFGLDHVRYAICALMGGGFGGIISTGKKPKKKFLSR